MRKIILFTFCFPFVLHAQLDRFRSNMTEAEFIRAFPEAMRDLESEAYWVNSWDTLEGCVGNSLWRIMNDSVAEYSFRSLKVDGPSYQFPAVDSSKAHKMRESAMKLEQGLVKNLGMPAIVRSSPLTVRPKDPVGNHDPQIKTGDFLEAYFAQWTFDDGKVIIIRMSTEMSAGNMINAPAAMQTQKSVSYELQVTVTRNSVALPWCFNVGRSYAQLRKSEPRVQGAINAGNTHYYDFVDREISKNWEARWKFTFLNGVLREMSYMSLNGIAYGDESTDIAYNSGKFRAETLSKEGEIAMGKPDSSINRIVDVYEPHDLTTSYQRHYLETAWHTPDGYVYLYFDELGGGKVESVRFSVRVNFIKLN